LGKTKLAFDRNTELCRASTDINRENWFCAECKGLLNTQMNESCLFITANDFDSDPDLVTRTIEKIACIARFANRTGRHNPNICTVGVSNLLHATQRAYRPLNCLRGQLVHPFGSRPKANDLFLRGQHLKAMGANSGHHHVNTVGAHIDCRNNWVSPWFF
jgi:hypothetical protein